MAFDPIQVLGYVDDDQFLILVDKLYNDTIRECKDTDLAANEEKMVEFLGNLAAFCYTQGCFMMISSIPKDHNGDHADQMLEANLAATNRYELARHYMTSTYSVELHPMFIMLFIRGMFDTRSKSTYDVEMAQAFQRYMDMREKDYKELTETHEVVNPDDIDTEHVDPDALKKFLDTFKDIGSFHRNRDTYNTDEERQKHDELMKLYYSIMYHKEEEQ